MNTILLTVDNKKNLFQFGNFKSEHSSRKWKLLTSIFKHIHPAFVVEPISALDIMQSVTLVDKQDLSKNNAE